MEDKKRSGRMSVAMNRLEHRFSLLSEDGLTNLKFFVDRRYEMSSTDFASEWSDIQDVISAGDIQEIEKVDIDAETRKFDEPF